LTDFAITNATVVLADQVVERGTVEITAGRISEVQALASRLRHDGREVIDGRGAYLLPGLVDLHNDSLELEINPRPRTSLPLPFALNNCERRLVACGVTTEFHAIGFMNRPSAHRTVDGARERSAYIAGLRNEAERVIDHHVLHRINVRDREALEIVLDSLSNFDLRYASLDDHTPGQGQFRDVETLYQRLLDTSAARGESAQAREEIEQRITLAAQDTATVPYVYQRVRSESRLRPITLASHDDHTPEKVDALRVVGATIAEFPVTADAAARAREHGMAIVTGAPNILRGGSQSGNVSAGELIRSDLADIICADYHAPSMLAATFKIVREGLRELSSAVRMVTLNPAQAVGLNDRGAIQPGLRADMILVRLDGHGFPHVEATFSRGRRAFTFAGQAVAAESLIPGGAPHGR
jgi:alpha-D-ribose 1-methylphosphonate 5-triphosphate diphosphatase